MDKRISSPFSQALYAVEVLTDRIKNLGRIGSISEDGGDQEDSQRLLSWRNSLHEQSRNIELQNVDIDHHDGVEREVEVESEDESPPPYDTDIPISPNSPDFPTTIRNNHNPSHYHKRRRRFKIDLIFLTIIILSIGIAGVLFIIFPFPTTIPAFITLFLILLGWTIINWIKTIYFGYGLFQIKNDLKKEYSSNYFNKFSTTKRTILIFSTLFLIYLLCLGFCVPEEELPKPLINGSSNEKYFIAANLHDSEDILPSWSNELIKLINYLGNENVFVSIYESNSHDSTKSLLSTLNQTLSEMKVGKQIITEQDDKHWWPYGTSPERISYLANARNKALEPIQHKDPQIRLNNYDEFTKVIFLNDVFFTWKSIIRLINTKIDGKDDYDQVCALDFGSSGLYDTWVARDICGTPLRPFWPYVKDEITISKIEKEQPFEVSSCWNGAVVFKIGPFLYKPESTPDEDETTEEEYGGSEMESIESSTYLGKRGWKMIDNPTYPNSVFSPTLSLPIQFRSSNISACDHSECFLIGYDLHRLYDTVERPPRIYMNPTVKLAYDKNWFVWHNKVLRIPVIHWWLENWSRGYPFYFVDWIWEKAGRRRDYCTWSALSTHLPERCPSLPGAQEKSWNE